MATPEKIKKYASRFKSGSWRHYSYEELAQWVNLLTKRATHRTSIEKAHKDLDDAENYLEMLNAKLAEDRLWVLKQWENKEEK
jgi:hypothetical protein